MHAIFLAQLLDERNLFNEIQIPKGVGNFITNYCVEGDFMEPCKDFYNVYKKTTMNPSDFDVFWTYMRKKYRFGFHIESGINMYMGVKLNEEGRNILLSGDNN